MLWYAFPPPVLISYSEDYIFKVVKDFFAAPFAPNNRIRADSSSDASSTRINETRVERADSNAAWKLVWNQKVGRFKKA